MAVTEYYSDVLSAMKTRLVNASGPFITNDQIQYGPPDAEGALAPIDRLVSLLSRTILAAAVITDSGSDFQNREAGDNASVETWNVTIHYGSRTPGGDDWQKAYGGQSGKYWGEFQLRMWILQRLNGWLLGGSTVKMEPYPLSRTNLIVSQPGVIACALTFGLSYVHDIATS